jgi:hypothetical protein
MFHQHIKQQKYTSYLELVQINFIFTDNVRILYINTHYEYKSTVHIHVKV